MKRFLASLLYVVMVVCMIPMTVLAADVDDFGGKIQIQRMERCLWVCSDTADLDTYDLTVESNRKHVFECITDNFFIDKNETTQKYIYLAHFNVPDDDTFIEMNYLTKIQPMPKESSFVVHGLANNLKVKK
ncbi:MAG: hypothetical protein HFE73_04970 [Firmicutes bacterium]|nr:hypothetical protein [Bacillota bacterium]